MKNKKKYLMIFIIAIIVAVGIMGMMNVINKIIYKGEAFEVGSYYPDVVISSYEELKALIYFGDLSYYTENMSSKAQISKFISRIKERKFDGIQLGIC